MSFFFVTINIDFQAKPDYQYSYGVEDPHTGNTQNHKETRDGDTVKGEYSLVEADGTVRVVKYTADSKNGFQVCFFLFINILLYKEILKIFLFAGCGPHRTSRWKSITRSFKTCLLWKQRPK